MLYWFKAFLVRVISLDEHNKVFAFSLANPINNRCKVKDTIIITIMIIIIIIIIIIITIIIIIIIGNKLLYNYCN